MNMQSVKRVSGWMFVLGCLGIVFGIEGCGKQAAEHPVETASHVREEDDVIQIPATSAEGQSTLVTPSLMKESQIHTPAIASAATTLTYLDTDTVVVKEGFENIYFDFDQWAISKLMQAQLAVSAQWLNTHPETMVSIEGYCDARGGRKYNVVLAEKRANAVKEVWVDLGVAEERLSTISYGREGLTCFTDDVQCHKANRRAQFVVK